MFLYPMIKTLFPANQCAGLSFSAGDGRFSLPVNNSITGNSDFQHQMILEGPQEFWGT